MDNETVRINVSQTRSCRVKTIIGCNEYKLLQNLQIETTQIQHNTLEKLMKENLY